LQLLFAEPIGQKPELANAHQAGGEYVQQEAAQELDPHRAS
jgi:hypothetical protein